VISKYWLVAFNGLIHSYWHINSREKVDKSVNIVMFLNCTIYFVTNAVANINRRRLFIQHGHVMVTTVGWKTIRHSGHHIYEIINQLIIICSATNYYKYQNLSSFFVSFYVWFDPGLRTLRMTGWDIVPYSHVLLEIKRMQKIRIIIKQDIYIGDQANWFF
jgi:hypothetical protein